MADFIAVGLKEWELQIEAMLAGRQAFLLRKGGILEAENEFELEHKRFLFFPTVVHQDPRMVKAEFREGLRQEREEPDRVTIRAYGEAVKVFEVPRPTEVGRKRLEALSDLYVWDAPLLDMRFAYRPEKPLYLVVVRAYRLREAVTIQNTLAYAGCKSWVPLAEGPENVGIDVSGAMPAVSEGRVGEIVERVGRTFAG